MKTRIERYAAATPKVAQDAFVAANATLIGDATMAAESSAWFQSVLRADLNHIVIGPRSNLQDGAVIHVADDFGTVLGQSVTVGHAAVLHACTIDDEVPWWAPGRLWARTPWSLRARRSRPDRSF